MEQPSKDSILIQSEGSINIPSLNAFGKLGNGVWGIPHRPVVYHASSDASLFSSSLPVLPHAKLNLTNSEPCHQSVDDAIPDLGKLCLSDKKDTKEDVKPNAVGSLLPDEDELLAGIMDDFDLSGLPSQLEDLEENDVFGSGGGMEMDFDPQESLSIGMLKAGMSDGVAGNEIGHYGLPNGVGAIVGEHPYGEHPSRTLFVRNINSNVEDSELRALFEHYGDIRTLYTACKHRGFVMISYYDIRAARTAMRTLQNKPLRRRKLDIHFSIPKDNPSEKDINQGTLVVFNLDLSVSNDELQEIFGAYGEVKEIRETPHKRHCKFIEFYDVRAAEAALRSLNGCEIAGKCIKLEPSRPGGASRNLMHQLSQELEQDELHSFHHYAGSPLTNSSPGNWPQYGSPIKHNPLQAFSQSQGLGALGSINGNHLSGLASILPSHTSSSTKIAPIGKYNGINGFNQVLPNDKLTRGAASQHSHSYSDQNLSVSPGLASSFSKTNSYSPAIRTLSGPQFLRGSPTQSEQHNSSAWPTSSVVHPYRSSGQGQGFLFPSRHHSVLGSHPHHVGSAPSGVPIDKRFGYFPQSPETSYMSPVAFGGLGSTHNNGGYVMNMGGQTGPSTVSNVTENGSTGFRMMSLTRLGSLFPGNGSYPEPGVASNESLGDRARGRRIDNCGSQMDNKKQYQLDLDRIISGDDTRTTLMIKNIPNKYTSKMLLATIDENHRGTYDFLYLPIDFKNKCNVGYAFINMVSPSHIIPFYKAFNGKKWEKFNSEKVAILAYARIQGKAALITHFQNSSLMNEDKQCRPILFYSKGQETADQEALLSSNLNIFIHLPDGTYSKESLESLDGNRS